METNGKDGSARTPPILNVQAIRTAPPLLSAQQARLAVPPEPASAQQTFVSPYPAFEAAEIRKRIQQNILLSATEQPRSFALPGARNPNAGFHMRGNTDKFPSDKVYLDAFYNWKDSINALKEPFCDEKTITSIASRPSDTCGYPVFRKDQSGYNQTTRVVHPQADMHSNVSMLLDSRGPGTLGEFRASGDQNPATQHVCPSQKIAHTQHSLESNAITSRVRERNPICWEQLQRGTNQSDSSYEQHSDLKQHVMPYIHKHKVAGGDMGPAYLNSTNLVPDGQSKIDIVSERVTEAANMEPNSIPSNSLNTESEPNIKPPNFYLRDKPDNRENRQSKGNTNPASLFQENTESNRIIQGEDQNIQIPSNSCRQFMEANAPIIGTPVKFNNHQLVIPKAECNPDYTTWKPPGDYGARRVHSASLYSGSPSLLPKSEYENSRSLAVVQKHTEPEGGSASALMVPNINAQVFPTAEELRSALAKSLKRFKDLTVLYPGSSALESHGNLSMSVNTETETGSRKRKRPRPTRPRPVIQNPYPSVNGNDRELVMRALVTYDALRRRLQDETRRPDLQAGVLMLDKGLAVNRDRRIVGAIPGINVGDHFYFRMELCVIGLHCPTQAGIDYITARNNEWNEPVATSIIASGGYEDEDISTEELIYTGHGGNNSVLDKKQPVDQKLERGNFALERSRHYQIEIRVIRGIKDSGSPSGKIYIYDGLYKVQDSWLDKGRSGSGVFKYKLIRTPGQPELGSLILKNTRRWKLDPTLRVGLVHPDVSSRSENLPVCLFNNVDNEKGPPHFEYITSIRYPDFLVSISQGCECVGYCNTMGNCSCIQKNGGQMPYNADGILIKGKPLVYECGNHCKCPLSCRNRTTQRGLKVRLEIFRTRGRSANANGWGVRSWDPIPAGSFICEYTGEVIYTEGIDAYHQRNADSEYILNPRKVTECGDVSHILCEQQQDASSILVCAPTPANLNFVVDASKMGNVSRFINYSSFPNANVFAQFVLHDHLDCRFPHVMFFALYNIPPLTELLLDYEEEKVLIQPNEERVLIQAKEEVDIGSGFECNHKIVKIGPSYT